MRRRSAAIVDGRQATLDHRRHPPGDLRREALDVVVGGRGKLDELEHRVVVLPDEVHRVGHHDMTVHVGIDRPAVALNEGHRQVLGIAVASAAGHLALVGKQHLHDDAHHRGDQSVVLGHQVADRPGEGGGPLPVAAAGQRHVHQICCLVAHAPGGT